MPLLASVSGLWTRALCGVLLLGALLLGAASASAQTSPLSAGDSLGPDLVRLLPPDLAPGEVFGLHPQVHRGWLSAGVVHPTDSVPGSLYVYDLSDGAYDSGESAWQRLAAPDATPGDAFGYASDLDGSTLVVGAPGRGSAAGGAYVFTHDGSTWGDGTLLPTPQGADSSGLGHHVDVDGDRIALGQIWSWLGGPARGRGVYVFERARQGAWRVDAEVREPADLADELGERPSDFGIHFDLDASTLAVSEMATNSVFLYERTDAGWEPYQRLRAPVDEEGYALPGNPGYGRALDLDGDLLVVGALRDNARVKDAGAAYVYRRGSDRAWNLEAKLVAPDADSLDMFGHWVAHDSGHIVVGAFRDGSADAPESGAAYVFARMDGGWAMARELVPPNAASRRYTAYTVDVHGGTAVLNPGEDLLWPNALEGPGGVWVADVL